MDASNESALLAIQPISSEPAQRRTSKASGRLGLRWAEQCAQVVVPAPVPRWSARVGQDRLIAEADALTPDNRFRVHTLESGHAGFVFQAARTAQLLSGVFA